MSEYQYFEFLAIDRPLSAREMDHLRAISTRARITPVSFVNEYNWGSLKADPVEFMRLFFDAHVYLANWGEALFMVRLPLEAIDEKTLEPFCTTSHLTVEKLPNHWLLAWSLLGETEEYDPFDFVEETGWMARLAPVREELLRGDLRSLAIGWLRAVTTGEAGVDALEPAPANGLQEWTGAQRALAEFLDVTRICWRVRAWTVCRDNRPRRTRRFSMPGWINCPSLKPDSICASCCRGKVLVPNGR